VTVSELRQRVRRRAEPVVTDADLVDLTVAASPGLSIFASYSDWIAASQNILLQLASRKRSLGCVVL
jgi:hypothetical protein